MEIQIKHFKAKALLTQSPLLEPPLWVPREVSVRRGKRRKLKPMLGNVVPGALLPVAWGITGQPESLKRRSLFGLTDRTTETRHCSTNYYGSGENPGEDERSGLQQVQQDTVHGWSLRKTAGNSGSAGNQVQ